MSVTWPTAVLLVVTFVSCTIIPFLVVPPRPILTLVGLLWGGSGFFLIALRFPWQR